MAVARRDEKRAGKPKAINCNSFCLWTAGQETKDMCIQVQHIRLSCVFVCTIFIFMHHRRRVCVHICVSLFREMCVSPQQHHVQCTCTCVPWYVMCTFFVACMQIIDTLPVVPNRDVVFCWTAFSTLFSFFHIHDHDSTPVMT